MTEDRRTKQADDIQIRHLYDLLDRLLEIQKVSHEDNVDGHRMLWEAINANAKELKEHGRMELKLYRVLVAVVAVLIVSVVIGPEELRALFLNLTSFLWR